MGFKLLHVNERGPERQTAVDMHRVLLLRKQSVSTSCLLNKNIVSSFVLLVTLGENLMNGDHMKLIFMACYNGNQR